MADQNAPENKPAEQAAPAPAPAPQPVVQQQEYRPAPQPSPVPKREKSKLVTSIYDELLQEFDAKVAEKSKIYIKTLADNEDRQQASNEKEYNKAFKRRKAAPSEDEKAELDDRKESLQNTFKMGGILAGVLLGAIIVANPPAALAAMITGLATALNGGAAAATATAAATAATAATASTVSMFMGLAACVAGGMFGRTVGDEVGKRASENLKPVIGQKSFDITPEREQEIEKEGVAKARAYAIESAIELAKQRVMERQGDYNAANVEVALEKLISKLRMDDDRGVSGASLSSLDAFRRELTVDLDREHERKFHDEKRLAIETKYKDREDAKDNLEIAKIEFEQRRYKDDPASAALQKTNSELQARMEAMEAKVNNQAESLADARDQNRELRAQLQALAEANAGRGDRR